MKNFKIYISCHKECYTPKKDFLFPIHVGAKNTNKRFEYMLRDDIGDNISEKNPMYCELTAQYYVWKNEEADYYGFFHYRRYMSFADERFETDKFENIMEDYVDDSSLERFGINRENIESYLDKYDVIATEKVNLKELDNMIKSNYHQYEITSYQYKEDLDILLDIIEEKYPDYLEVAKEYYDSKEGYFCNMFIMRKDIFEEYSNWLFDILEEHEKRRDYSNYTKEAYRVSGYLGERLFGIYYNYLKKNNKYRCHEVQRTLFKNVDKTESLQPAFKENNVAIALAANDYFIPYTATVIKSVIDNSNKGNNYDIIILTHDISEINKNRLADMIKEEKNFSIRYVNPKRFIENRKLFVRGHFSLETYYRLVLPEILKEYDKILYLDSDMIVVDDVATLYNVDVKGYLLAASLDADTAGLYNGYEPNKKEYMDTIMKMEDPYKYFQAGTLLMNLESFRAMYTTEEILELSSSYDWELLDQDILNILCKDKVKYIDMSWNYMVDMERRRIRDIISLAPHWLNDMYMEARKNPKIIHYAGAEKPWLVPEMDMADEFWKYARKTVYYEIMLYRMSIRNTKVHNYEMETKNGFINKLLPYGSKRREGIKKIYYLFVKNK